MTGTGLIPQSWVLMVVHVGGVHTLLPGVYRTSDTPTSGSSFFDGGVLDVSSFDDRQVVGVTLLESSDFRRMTLPSDCRPNDH